MSDKMSKGFHITSVCRNDILQMIDDIIDDEDELKTLMLINGVKNITDGEMKAIASNLCDAFCEEFFWDNLEYIFKKIMMEKNDIKKI